MMTGKIFNIQRFSVNDGPGIRTTVFLKGCPLYCTWCHNPESRGAQPELMFRQSRCIRCGACVGFCPQQAIRFNGSIITDLKRCANCGACVEQCYADAREIVGRSISVDALLWEIEKDRPFYDESGGGLTVSGGEPLQQPAFVQNVLQACKAQGIHTALDTCGYAEWASLERCRHFVDLFLYDLKIMDDARHTQYTGVSNRLILQNLQRLSEHGHNITIRQPIIPGITDDGENILAIASFVSQLPQPHQIDLLPYHSIARDKYARLQKAYSFADMQPPAQDKLYQIKDHIQQFGINVNIGG